MLLLVRRMTKFSSGDNNKRWRSSTCSPQGSIKRVRAVYETPIHGPASTAKERDTAIAVQGAVLPELEAALAEVDRADFLPADLKPLAYEEIALPIADGITVPPKGITSLVIELLDLKPSDRVLEIGTGSGYQTTVLSRLCAEVVSVEVSVVPNELLRSLPENVSVYGDTDGRFGPVNEGRFDAVLVTAGSQCIYDFWKNCLNEGGRLVVPLGDSAGGYEIRKFVKVNGELSEGWTFAFVNVVPLRR